MNESFKEIDSHLKKIDFQNIFKKMEEFENLNQKEYDKVLKSAGKISFFDRL